MAVKGPKGSDPPPAPRPINPGGTEARTPAPAPAPAKRPREVEPSPDRRRQQDEAAAELSAEGRIGDPSLPPEAFRSMGTLVSARHLMALLARKRPDVARAALLAEVGDLLLAEKDPTAIRRILLQMGEVGRIVDIYPLEVLDYVLHARPAALPGFSYGPVILNKVELESRTFGVEELIRIKVPLSLRMRGFALEGGGAPGYCFAPGGLAEYHLELAAPGAFPILVRGEIRKKSLIDRAILTIEDRPDGQPQW